MIKANDFLYSLPESLTGAKDSKEYPLENIKWYGTTFKKKPDGTINIEDIRTAVAWTIKSLYDHEFLTIKPLAVIVQERSITNVANETLEWVTITSYLDNSDH